MKYPILALSALALGVCTTVAAAPAKSLPEAGGAPEANSCRAEAAQSFVGRTADQATGAAILSASGARSLRWIAPNSAVTMDYRQDRVNVSYDAAMTIERIGCG